MMSLREAFGQALVELAAENEFLVVDSDVACGTSTNYFRDAYPKRFFNFGISEQATMAGACGLNIATGLPVFVTGFASFLMRAWEVARLSVCCANRNIKIVASHGGLDGGEDGPSNQCLEDLACWRSLLNMTVICPSSPTQMKLATKAILDHNGPVYMRTGRSVCKDEFYGGDLQEKEFSIGQTYNIQYGKEGTMIACGKMVSIAMEANKLLGFSDKIGFPKFSVIDMPTLQPVNNFKLQYIAERTPIIFTLEDHSICGGLGSVICEFVSTLPKPIPVIRIGTCRFGESGTPDELMKKYELDARGVAGRIIRELRYL